ncbi:MAG: efflux transporter outer membrane subunit, partial [Hyphomonadaceae bacterium]
MHRHLHHTARLMAGVSLTLLLSACASRPDLPAAPTDYASARAVAALSADGAQLSAEPIPAWIDALDAPEMTSFVREALGANPELNAAKGRAEAARYRARGERGGLLPDLNLEFGRSRTETPIPGTDDRARADLTTSRLASSWEIDIWGRLTARALSADLTADALAFDLDAARLSVAGQAARGWVDLVAAQQLLALAQEDMTTRNRALELTQRRYERGLAESLALRTARSQSASARANEAEAAEAHRIAARSLQEILGRYPDAALNAEAELPQLQAISAAGAPQDLLERRPDVVAAEARMRAAGFAVHEARAAMLPRLTLSASADGEGQGFGDVTDIDNLVTTILGSLTAPIFQGGRLRNEAYASAAEQRTAAADYVGAVLAAWREVETAISNDQSLAVQERELAAAVSEAREAQALAEREYGRGVATIFELIDAYTRRIDAERGLIDVRAERVRNRILYHVALGGGAETGG